MFGSPAGLDAVALREMRCRGRSIAGSWMTMPDRRMANILKGLLLLHCVGPRLQPPGLLTANVSVYLLKGEDLSSTGRCTALIA